MRELALVVSGNSPQVHCMWDSALSKLSEGLTTSSESLLGEKASDKLWLKKENIYIYKCMYQQGKCSFTSICSALCQYTPVIFWPLPIRQRITIKVVSDNRQFWIHVSHCGYRG